MASDGATTNHRLFRPSFLVTPRQFVPALAPSGFSLAAFHYLRRSNPPSRILCIRSGLGAHLQLAILFVQADQVLVLRLPLPVTKSPTGLWSARLTAESIIYFVACLEADIPIVHFIIHLRALFSLLCGKCLSCNLVLLGRTRRIWPSPMAKTTSALVTLSRD